jgi:N-acetylglucosamine-6-phosphate deacetylase
VIGDQGRYALVNGEVVLPDAVVAGRALVVDGSRVVGLAGLDDLGEMPVHDVGGRYIAPGLIDIHIHGAMGHSFDDPSETSYNAILEENARCGVTSLLVTLSTAPIPRLVRCLEFSRLWMRAEHGGAQVLGVHLEGPYFSLEQRGAQDPRHIRMPDDGSADALLEHSDVTRILTLAPELPGAIELIHRIVASGVVAAAGHSSARDSDLYAAEEAGLRHIIHLWSGQSSTVREGPWRRPGLLEASLASTTLTGEIIADNRHLPPTLMKLAYRCFGAPRLCAISDATSGAGLPDGTTFGMGEMTYEVRDGVGMLPDQSSFAGSTTLLGRMIPILVEQVGIPIAHAFRMTSLTPASVIGVDARKGSLEPGKDADIAIFTKELTPWRTVVGGKQVSFDHAPL